MSLHENKAGRLIPPESLPLFRVYSSKLNDHFYTASLTELNTLPTHGWVLESCLGFIGALQGDVPIYRAWAPGFGDHFYTHDLNEYVNACKNGYTGEGIAGYGKPQSAHTIPLYRYNLVRKDLPANAARDHFYTIDKDEVKSLSADYTVSDEGILCYIDKIDGN
jgi:hypothetical protein